MRRIYFCVALIAGIWTVSVGDLSPIPVGSRAKALSLAKASAQDLWRSVKVPTCVRVKEGGAWYDEELYGEESLPG